MRIKGALLGIAVAAALAVPSSAQAGTIHWAVGSWLAAGQGLYNGVGYSLTSGVYCHELDPDYARQIQINAVWWDSAALYGSWVQYTTSGLRSYAGVNYLRGACRNPHSVGYAYNAHDNHYDV